MKKILLLPGLGDVHWVFLKLQSWLQRHGPEWDRPEIHIWDIDNRPRTLAYLSYVPWVQVGDYFNMDLRSENKKFNSLYINKGSQDVLYDFHGFDAVIGTNGNMRNGVPFSEIMGGAEIDYQYGPVLPPNGYGRRHRLIGPYFVLCFSGFGMFENAWCRKMNPVVIKRMVSDLRAHYPDHRFLFTGCPWDYEFAKLCCTGADELLVGSTTLPQFFSLLQYSSGYIGWCGGNAILAQHLNVPTVTWWSRVYFPKHDRTGWETPHERKVHMVLDVEDYRRETTVPQIISFLEATHA